MKRMWLLCLALAACGQPSGNARPDTTAQPAASAAATVPPTGAPPALRPPGRGASREEREKAVRDLLTGQAHPADLPLADVDRGEEFEPLLRAAMTTPMEIRLGAITVTDLDEKEVRAAMETERSKMRFRICYSMGLRDNPNLQGRIAARVAVKAAGKPESVEDTGSEMPDSAVARCAIKALGKVEFPAPRGTAGQASVTLLFSP